MIESKARTVILVPLTFIVKWWESEYCGVVVRSVGAVAVFSAGVVLDSGESSVFSESFPEVGEVLFVKGDDSIFDPSVCRRRR